MDDPETEAVLLEAKDSLGSIGPVRSRNDVVPILATRLRRFATDAASQPHGFPLEAPPEIIEQARTMLPEMRRLTEPGPDKYRLAVLVALADMVGKPDVLRNGDDHAQTLFWRTYLDLLTHLPPNVLNRAAQAYLRQPPAKGKEKWLPDPGTLLGLVREDYAWQDIKAMAVGLERLTHAKAKVKPAPPTPEEEAALAEKMAAWKARFSASIAAEREAELAARAESGVFRRPDGKLTLRRPAPPPTEQETVA